MKDRELKIKIFEEKWDHFLTFVNFANIRNNYIENGFKLFNYDNKMFDNNGKLVSDKIISFDYVDNWLRDLESSDRNLYRVYDNLRKSYCKKRIRCFKRVQYLFDNYKYVFFVTLTFNDKNLKKKYNTRRRNAIKFVKRFDCYICNIDFGDLHEREHYHALVGFNADYKCPYLNKWKMGFYYLQCCSRNDDDKVRIAKYVIKLTNHNVKKSTKNSNIIYSDILKCIK